MARTVAAVILMIFSEALSVSPRALTNAVNFVLKGMSRIGDFDDWQGVWKYLIIHIRLFKNMLCCNTLLKTCGFQFHFPFVQNIVVTLWMSSFNLVIDEGDRSVSYNGQQFPNMVILHYRLCSSHVKCHHTKLGHMVVIDIWNVDAQQRETYLTWAESCYIMSVLNNLSYLLVSIMLLSQDRVPMIFIYSLSNLRLITSLSP